MGIVKERQYCPEDDEMVLAERQTPNHILHLLLTLVTAGFWIIIWGMMIVLSDPFRCPQCGAKTSRKPPKGWVSPRRRERDYA